MRRETAAAAGEGFSNRNGAMAAFYGKAPPAVNASSPDRRTVSCRLTRTGSASENGLPSRSGLKDRLSTFFLGASDLTIHTLHQLEDFRSALIRSTEPNPDF